MMLTEKQIDFLKSLGLDDNYFPNEIGTMCESILDIIP